MLLLFVLCFKKKFYKNLNIVAQKNTSVRQPTRKSVIKREKEEKITSRANTELVSHFLYFSLEMSRQKLKKKKL